MPLLLLSDVQSTNLQLLHVILIGTERDKVGTCRKFSMTTAQVEQLRAMNPADLCSMVRAIGETSLFVPRIDFAALLNAQTDVAAANALTTSCAYLTTPAVAALLSARVKVASTYSPLWDGNILEGNVCGFRGRTTVQMPAATAIFGDFSQVIFAEWGAIQIAANPFANFPMGITGIRAFMTADVGVRIAGAYSASDSIT